MLSIDKNKLKKEKKIIGYNKVPYYVDCSTCMHQNKDTCKPEWKKMKIKLNSKFITKKICENWKIKTYLLKVFKKK